MSTYVKDFPLYLTQLKKLLSIESLRSLANELGFFPGEADQYANNSHNFMLQLESTSEIYDNNTYSNKVQATVERLFPAIHHLIVNSVYTDRPVATKPVQDYSQTQNPSTQQIPQTQEFIDYLEHLRDNLLSNTRCRILRNLAVFTFAMAELGKDPTVFFKLIEEKYLTTGDHHSFANKVRDVVEQAVMNKPYTGSTVFTHEKRKPIIAKDKCVQCHKAPREVVSTACGHVCLCPYCAFGIDPICPICKATTKFIKLRYD